MKYILIFVAIWVACVLFVFINALVITKFVDFLDKRAEKDTKQEILEILKKKAK